LTAQVEQLQRDLSQSNKNAATLGADLAQANAALATASKVEKIVRTCFQSF
jgi:hypothetical protein